MKKDIIEKLVSVGYVLSTMFSAVAAAENTSNFRRTPNHYVQPASAFQPTQARSACSPVMYAVCILTPQLSTTRTNLGYKTNEEHRTVYYQL
jgi:hypothetical protein